MKVLITAGATIERIDPIRYISNFSSGKQGYAIAEVLSSEGFEVTLISGNCNLPLPKNVNIIKIESAEEMLKAALNNLPCDIAIFCAAVSDWKMKNISSIKLKKIKEEDTLNLQLIKNPDILKTISNHELRPKLVIGFAAETNNLLNNARIKLKEKNCDWIIANQISKEYNIFNSDKNEVYWLSKDAEEFWPKASKIDIAKRLLDKIKEFS